MCTGWHKGLRKPQVANTPNELIMTKDYILQKQKIN